MIELIITFVLGCAAGATLTGARLQIARGKHLREVKTMRLYIDGLVAMLDEKKYIINHLNGEVGRLNKRIKDSGLINTMEKLRHEQQQ